MNYIENNESLVSIIENIIGGICVFAIDDNRNISPMFLNEGFYRMMGYNHSELEKMIKNIRRIIIPDDLPIFEQGIDDILKDDGAVEFEFRTVTGDGGIRWLQVRGNLYGKFEGYKLMAGVILDATERKSVAEELALQAERLNILSATVNEHLIDYNSRTDVMNLSLDSNAYSRGEIVFKDYLSSEKLKGISDKDQLLVREILEAAIRTPLSDSFEFRSDSIEEPKDKLQWYRATITSVRGADGYVSRVVGRIVNINEQKLKEIELTLRADKDALTGLYNKGTATTLIGDAIQNCNIDGTLAALLMIDLDHFKSVNDTFGHAVGDSVIADAGKVLNDTFKGRDIVGRMGGDEFMVFMQDIKGFEDAVGIAQKLNKSLTKNIEDSSGHVKVTASIGIAMCDNSTNSFESLYEKADKALYITKSNGRDGMTLFSEDI